MIDQVCSLALTYAHSDGRPVFSRRDLLEAMTPSRPASRSASRTRSTRSARPRSTRPATPSAAHVYMENGMSTRLSIRKRGRTGGHHQAMEIEDRFGHWRSEEVGDLIWGLGAMAAEHVFYDQNTTGVGGDLGWSPGTPRTWSACTAWRPAPIDLSDRIADREEREEDEKQVMERFEKLGFQLMHRSGARSTASLRREHGRPARSASSSPACSGRRSWSPGTRSASTAKAPSASPNRLIAAGELYGDDVTDLLDECPPRQARDRRPGRDVMARDLIPPPSPAGRPQPGHAATAARRA